MSEQTRADLLADMAIEQRERAERAEAENARLRARVARLEAALRNIRIAAARGVSFGHQATPQTSERMVERKDEALHCVIEFCGQAGVTGSVLRDAALTGEKEHLRPHDVAHLALTRKLDEP